MYEFYVCVCVYSNVPSVSRASPTMQLFDGNVITEVVTSRSEWLIVVLFTEERRLKDDEYPLTVQLNWGKDDREGRFLLKDMDEKTHLVGVTVINVVQC